MLVLVVVTALAYVIDPGRKPPVGGALGSDFAFDDIHLIVTNTRLERPAGALDGFVSDYYTSSQPDISGQTRALGYYRPVAVFSNWLDRQIWGLRPLGFHLTNLLLHLGVVLGFYLLLVRAFGRRDLAFASALVFGVHPVHPESVTFISGRVDVLAALFSVFSLYFLVRSWSPGRSGRDRIVSLALFLLALMSKEMAITLPAAVFLLEGLARPDGRRGWKAAFRRSLPYVGVIALYLVIRLVAIGSIVSRAGVDRELGAVVPRAITVISTYLGLLVWPPFGFNVEPPITLPDGFTAGLVIRALILIGLAAGAVLLAVRRTWIAGAVGLLWMGAGLLPVSQILPVETMIGERYLYIPSLGACLVLGAALTGIVTALARRVRAPARGITVMLAALLAGLTVAYGANTIHRNTFWKDNYTFWSAKCGQGGGTAESHTALAIEKTRRGDIPGAIQSYQRALQIDVNHVEALNNLALLLLQRGHLTEAVQAATQIIRTQPNNAIGLNTLATCYHSMGKFGEAVGQYKRAIRNRPDYREAWVNLANTYFTAGAIDSARTAYRRAVDLQADPQLDIQIARCYALAGDVPGAMSYLHDRGQFVPNTPPSLVMQGNLEFLAGKHDAGIASVLRATEIDPSSVEAWVELGQMMAQTRQPDRAREAFERALAIDPGLSVAENNLGVLSEETGNFEEAVTHYQRALSFAPEDPEVLRNLGGALVETGRYREAIDPLNRSLTLAPRDPLSYFYRARAFERMGRSQLALADYRSVTVLNPVFPDPYYQIGDLLLDAGREAEAAGFYEEFLNWARADDPRREAAIQMIQSLDPDQ